MNSYPLPQTFTFARGYFFLQFQTVGKEAVIDRLCSYSFLKHGLCNSPRLLWLITCDLEWEHHMFMHGIHTAVWGNKPTFLVRKTTFLHEMWSLGHIQGFGPPLSVSLTLHLTWITLVSNRSVCVCARAHMNAMRVCPCLSVCLVHNLLCHSDRPCAPAGHHATARYSSWGQQEVTHVKCWPGRLQPPPGPQDAALLVTLHFSSSAPWLLMFFHLSERPQKTSVPLRSPLYSVPLFSSSSLSQND